MTKLTRAQWQNLKMAAEACEHAAESTMMTRLILVGKMPAEEERRVSFPELAEVAYRAFETLSDLRDDIRRILYDKENQQVGTVHQ